MPQSRPKDSPEQTAPFRLRGTTVNLVVLQLLDPETGRILPELERLLRQAPAFLHNAPIIIGLDSVRSTNDAIDFSGLIEGLRKLNLFPIGVSGGKPSQQDRAAKAGLPTLPKGAARATELASVAATAPATPPAEETLEPASAEPAAAADRPAPPANAPKPAAPVEAPPAAAAEPAAVPAMLLTTPVRAGQQIYADKGADLIITATVNPGAEVIADGHIHVYGALRGRAIAGAAGYEGARIFALRFDPELVAIAGLYRVREDLDQSLIGERIQLRLEGDHLRFDRLDGRS
jgi:septum site-determining protein MinC